MDPTNSKPQLRSQRLRLDGLGAAGMKVMKREVICCFARSSIKRRQEESRRHQRKT